MGLKRQDKMKGFTRLPEGVVLVHLLAFVTNIQNVTAGEKPNTTDNDGEFSIRGESFSEDMMVGLLTGFGVFIGLLTCLCVTWCCCCKGCSSPEVSNRRIGPSPPSSRSTLTTRVSTRPTTRTTVRSHH